MAAACSQAYVGSVRMLAARVDSEVRFSYGREFGRERVSSGGPRAIELSVFIMAKRCAHRRRASGGVNV